MGDFLPPVTVGEPQVSEDAALLDAPTLLDPQNSTNLLVGTCRVWRGPAQSGTGWSAANALSRAMDGSAVPCSLTSALIRAVGAGGPVIAAASAAQSGSQVLYAGMAGSVDGGGSLGGHVFVTKSANTANAKTAWTDTAYGAVVNGSAGFNATGADVSSVVADAHDAAGATVYVTVMGFGGGGVDSPHVYRSSDFGAHWTDVTANLPNAPANSLVVDPNDANTVYVALDVGVYVTQAISTCATANCWSPLGTGLPNAPVTQLQAAAALATGDGRLGMLRASTYGRGIWQTPLLSAVSTQTPGLRASIASLVFASQQQGTQSAAQTMTLTSTGNSPVTVSSIVMTGDFVETDTCSGQTLAVGASCTVQVSFAPTATGERTGLLTAYANIAGGQVTVALSGTATAPAAVVLTPVFLTFPSTVVNATAATQIVTISNTGGNPATLQTPTITGDFAIKQSTCGATLASQTGCSVVISFTPTANGVRDRHVESGFADLWHAADWYHQWGAAGDADERGRCASSAGGGLDHERGLCGYEWMREFSGGAQYVRDQRDVCADGDGNTHGCVECDRSGPLADCAAAWNGCGSARGVVNPREHQLRVMGCGAELADADGGADQQRRFAADDCIDGTYGRFCGGFEYLRGYAGGW